TAAAQVTRAAGNPWAEPLQRVDRPVAAGERGTEVGWQMASRGYFEALQIPLRSGRLFDSHDASGPPVMIITHAPADQYFPGESPLGHRIDMGDSKPEIVGVVGSIRRTSLV